MYQWWRTLICTYLLSPKVSSKLYSVYPINIEVIGNIVNTHCGGEHDLTNQKVWGPGHSSGAVKVKLPLICFIIVLVLFLFIVLFVLIFSNVYTYIYIFLFFIFNLLRFASAYHKVLTKFMVQYFYFSKFAFFTFDRACFVNIW